VLLHYLAKRETQKLHFSLAVSLHCQNSTCLVSSIFLTHDLRLILTLLYDSINLVINAFSLGLFFGGRMVQEKGSRERCSSWTVLHAQSTSALSFGFPISQGNAEALDRWGGKTKHHLISYFLSNNSAKIIAVGSCMSILQQVKGGTFLRHSAVQHITHNIAYSKGSGRSWPAMRSGPQPRPVTVEQVLM